MRDLSFAHIIDLAEIFDMKVSEFVTAIDSRHAVLTHRQLARTPQQYRLSDRSQKSCGC